KELWQAFMSKRSTITNTIGTAFYSIEVYDNLDFFEQFDPTHEFEKWAAVQARDYEAIPNKMEKLTISTGLYAVFTYQGKSSEFTQFYQNIYGSWLPNSGYQLNDRPHFALMGEKYRNNDSNSEEETWIPVIPKS
ncbi:MAG: GyrI-like domain-containing protein, partial [Tunicatimonas sp.]|uniref:GyrI-like domain-containing protein n=1 Tax=Tunicatimonas sp. TaxID=1940096 RepID=UPI003C72EE4D